MVTTRPMIPMISGKVNNWDIVPLSGLNGRIGYTARQGLGGSSAISAMVYIRGRTPNKT